MVLIGTKSSRLFPRSIAEAGRTGLDPRAIDEEMDDRVLIEPRVKDLLTDKMATFRDGKYRLSGKGVVIARVFSFYRHLMGAGKGG